VPVVQLITGSNVQIVQIITGSNVPVAVYNMTVNYNIANSIYVEKT
jgi:hypothetical protein